MRRIGFIFIGFFLAFIGEHYNLPLMDIAIVTLITIILVYILETITNRYQNLISVHNSKEENERNQDNSSEP